MTKLEKRRLAPIGNIKEAVKVLRVGLISRMEEVDKPQPPKEHKQRAPPKKGSNLNK